MADKRKKRKAKKGSRGRNRTNRNHKDTLFRYIFKGKMELLTLYNALSGKEYSDPAALEITTLENVIYLHMKNDISFLIDHDLNLYEHQSSFNPNMPLRGLFYITMLYGRLVEEGQMYSTRQIHLPTPHYVVFYNGSKEMADYMELKLSEAFFDGSGDGDVEVIAHMYNINCGHNRELMEKCRKLWEYSYFIGQIRHYRIRGNSLEEAAELAVSDCLDQGILTEILGKERAAVMRFILEEFDQKKYEKVIREDGYEDGYASGTKDGYASGTKDGYASGSKDGYSRGIKVGEHKVKEMIQTMLGLGMALDQIAQIADMTAEEVEQMMKI